MIPAPSKEAIATAFRGGARVVFGWPTQVIDGDVVHNLDLVAASTGRVDPWTSTRTTMEGKVVEVVQAGQCLFGVAGITSPTDTRAIRAALAAAPSDKQRHDAEANAMRAEAGKLAMAIRDATVRTHIISMVEGWEGVIGTVIDRSDADGILGEPSIEGVVARILVVTCPSTGRRYAHLVPGEMKTAREARWWVMGVTRAPEIET